MAVDQMAAIAAPPHGTILAELERDPELRQELEAVWARNGAAAQAREACWREEMDDSGAMVFSDGGEEDHSS